MSEASQGAGDTSDGTSVETGAAASGATGTETPPGFVPASELERERQRAREFQSRYDQLVAERSQGNGASSGANGRQDDSEGGSSFDPDSFRQSVLSDVLRAQSMVSGVERARSDFPHADPALFAPERVAQFGSVESFRFAAEESHRRVASILDTERTAIESKLREELGLQDGGAGGSQGDTPTQGGDPTPEALAAMTMEQWDKLEEDSPGLIARVLARAEADQ